MTKIYPMQDMGLMEMSNSGGYNTVDTSGYGGVYNTPSGDQGLLSGLTDSLSNMNFGNAQQWDTAGNVMGGLGSIGNVVIGFQQLGLLEDQLALQEEQWAESQQELAHLRTTRANLGSSYMA